MISAITSAVQERDNGRTLSSEFTVEYWGQSEFVKDSSGNGISITFWQPIFFVRGVSSTATSTGTKTYSPLFDFKVNMSALNTFLTTFNSSRQNFYGSSLPFDSTKDYIMSDLHALPCYGQTFVQSYNIIMQLVQNEWIKYFQEYNLDDIAASLDLQTFPVLSLAHVNYKGYFSVLPFGVKSSYGQMYPEVFTGPTLSKLKAALSGYCDIQDGMGQIYRQSSLNYIQASGYLTIDQAEEYIPSIKSAYESYFASAVNKVKLGSPAVVIRSIENRFVNQIIVTRMYYQLFGNTSQPLNAFNYQIRHSPFTIETPSNLAPLVARSMRIMGESRIDLLNKEGITTLDTMLDSLPQVALDNEITEDQKQGLIESLKTFWTMSKSLFLLFNSHSKCWLHHLISYLFLKDFGEPVNSIEVQLGTTQSYFNTRNQQHVTYVYYIMAIDGEVKLRENLPNLDSNGMNKLNAELKVNGFNLATGPYVRTRTVYIDANSATVAFKKAATVNAIKNSWIQYLAGKDVAVSNNNLIVWMVDQNLFYDLKYFIDLISYE